MSYNNYKYQGTSSQTPHNTLQIVDSPARYIYSAQGVNISQYFRQSKDKGLNWTSLIPTAGSIRAIWYDRANTYIYVLQYDENSPILYLRRIDLSDEDNISYSTVHTDPSLFDAIDTFIISSAIYVSYIAENAGNYDYHVENIAGGDDSQAMDSSSNTEWDCSQMIIIGTKAYFIWRISSGNAEIWVYDSVAGTITNLHDLGSGTELSSQNQRAIAYDDLDILYFVLGEGTCEIGTVDCTGGQAGLSDDEYFTFQALRKHFVFDYTEENRERNFAVWFNASGVASGPTVPGYTLIEADISGAGSDQDVSDLLVSALNGYGAGWFVATNGGGTSTTVTITNYYAGSVVDIADNNTDLGFATSQQGVDKTNYLYSYEISTDTLVKISEYDIALMLDRNTASGVLEKGFHLTEPKIYQISSGKAWLYHISTLNTDKSIIAITDNFVFTE